MQCNDIGLRWQVSETKIKITCRFWLLDNFYENQRDFFTQNLITSPLLHTRWLCIVTGVELIPLPYVFANANANAGFYHNNWYWRLVHWAL